jgi:pimeloyl-ACP methyl ester carboxylesterase
MSAIEAEFAAINGAQIYYEIAGAGQPVVFVHAGIADRRMWDSQFEAFAERYRVLRYDHRGMGKSSMPAGTYALRDDLHALMRHFGGTPAVLIGCSMGGSVALDCVLEHPDAARALVLVCAGVSGNTLEPSDAMKRLWKQVDELAGKRDLDGANEIELRMWVDGVRRTPDQVDPAVRELVREMNLASFTRDEERKQGQPQAMEPPAFGRLGEVHLPTLVIVGSDDQPLIVQTADILASQIPGARKVVMEGLAHVPNMEQPAEFNQIVLDFLDEVARPKGVLEHVPSARGDML